MSTPELAKVLPPDTELSKPFWEGCRNHQLLMQQCKDCDRFQFYPRIVCNHCEGGQLSWQPVSGEGRVASFTIVRRGISKAYEAPYVVALVDLKEGPRMMTSVVGCDPESVAVGDTVEVAFEPWGSNNDAEYVVPVFSKR